MDVMIETKEQKIERLTAAWKDAKRAESQANADRIAIESEIYELTADCLPDKGTYTTETGMKITTGFSEEWDQAALNAAYQNWPGLSPFPFTGIWKPDGKAISYLRDNLPDAYKIIQPALTLKPKKPAFSVKE
ncbi:MAG: hypothetical protein U0835_00275 [Isosphaeraceae bacterium]